MGHRTIYKERRAEEQQRDDKTRLTNLEIQTSVANNTVIAANKVNQFQATQFTKAKSWGECRINALTAATTIDEETQANVVAYTKFDDLGGDGDASQASWLTADPNIYEIKLFDNEGREVYVNGDRRYIAWSDKHPTVSNTKQFVVGKSLQINVPGTVTADQFTFIDYYNNAAYNISVSVSFAQWFYPTSIAAIGAEPYRYLAYRYIDASNYYAVVIKPADSKLYVFVNEAGTITKLRSNANVLVDAWNLYIVTYNPTTNALVIDLNNSSASTTPSDTLTVPYTTFSDLFTAGLPGLPNKRFSGYFDNFVFWSGKILTSTERSNFYTRGTIV
jgi:hypothetical protein